METAPLKSFATWARAALIREVTARIAVVLAPASPLRVEQPKAVAELEAAITAAGGGDKGRRAVADRVAYTWFNRIIALRFMDASGYTGIGIVSPQAGVEVGQPEILAEAKRANIDHDVVDEKTRETVAGLLNGTRRSGDPQGEAYALLLAEYCRYWNRSMPFMFEREGDFTELLIPANLLADDSVLNRAVKVLTENVCQDVEVIGWLYQFYISERKDEVFAGFKKGKKAGADEVPAATQLFTPHWIVRYLVENSLGRLWMLNRPSSRLVEQMAYYVDSIGPEPDFLKVNGPEEIKVIDPACGSGHMLTYAFDILYSIYEEEGYAPAEIPGLILSNNLHGVEIDPRAGALAAFAITMKARERQRTFFSKQAEPHICVLEPISFSADELDLLIERGSDRAAGVEFWNQFVDVGLSGWLTKTIEGQDRFAEPAVDRIVSAGDIFHAALADRVERLCAQLKDLSTSFNVIIANPPYMGSRNMDEKLREFADENYPLSKADLYSMFLDKALNIADAGAYVAMVTMQNWMYLPSHVGLRTRILKSASIVSMAHLGTRAFETISGDVVSTTAVVIRNATSQNAGIYFRLTDLPADVKAQELIRLAHGEKSPRRYSAKTIDFELIPDSPIAYDFSDEVRDLYRANRSLGERIALKQGMATTNNARFLRMWHEVSLKTISRGCSSTDEVLERKGSWVPYNKGGTPNSWYGNQDWVVRWKNAAADLAAVRPRSVLENRYFFQPSVSWSNIGTSGAKFRYYPTGFVFDVAGMSAFPAEDEQRLLLLGYLNSAIVGRLLQTLAPTVNYQIGDIAKLPYFGEGPAGVSDLVRELIELRTAKWRADETSWDFETSPLLGRGSCVALAVDAACNSFDELDNKIKVLEQTNDKAWSAALRISEDAEGSGLAALTADRRDLAEDLVSYAVGCIFGRYSLDKPGLILADQNATLQDYLERVPSPSFMPDADNVIPIVDGDWFEDDIVTRFRQFLRAAFGESKFEENLRFVTEALGVKDLRDYFVKSFYKDHVQRYKKRPIYWLFSSPKGSFNALIYVHRYTPSTVSVVLNEYLREFKAKLEATLGQQERLAAGGGAPRQQAAAQKEADQIRKLLLELDEYEHGVLYPLATQQIEIDLDDGVKVNYPKFGAALKTIPGLEAGE
ncbi:MAG TPA: BREX-1 system adenine-specific DNA-methyltransferase PglX [Mycobacterium sp.]|nr:BREX-1 system adenine-specific DNA-methyltransferase PglX [Mycobacterium sp.]